MESSDDVSVKKPPSLPPDYVSLAQLQQQWIQRQKEKRLAEEQEKRIAEERQQKEKEKQKQKLPETASRSEVRVRKEKGGERVQWRTVDGTHLKSEELNVGAPAADHPVAGAGGKIKKGRLNKKGARVRGTLIGEEKCGRVEFGDKGLKGEVPITGTGVSKGHALPRIDTEGVSMKGNRRLKEKTQAFDDKGMVSGDPSGKTRRDSRCEENVVGEGGSVKGNGRRKKKIERGSQAAGDKEMASGNLSMKTRRDLSSEGHVALQGNAELVKTKTQDGCSVIVGRKRGEERSRNGYHRKWGDAMESEMESGYAENVVDEGLLVGKNERQKGKSRKTERGSRASGDKGMVSGNVSTKIRRDSVEESGEGNVSVRKGSRGKKDKRRTAIGDVDGDVEGGTGVFMLEVVPENKGKEVSFPGDKGSEEMQIPVTGNVVDQGMLEVVSERRRGGGRFRLRSRKNVDRRGKWGGSRDGKIELGLNENVEKDGVLAEGNEGQVEKTEMGSQTYGDPNVLSVNISTNIGRDFSSLSLDERREGNVILRKDQCGWQRKKFGRPRAATGFAWVKKGEMSEPSIAEN